MTPESIMVDFNKESPNSVQEYHDWLKEKFPSIFSEGKLNFEKLEEPLKPISLYRSPFSGPSVSTEVYIRSMYSFSNGNRKLFGYEVIF